jgi:hypothetical protein
MWYISRGLSQADAVFFGSMVVALPAELMGKTVGSQAHSCVSQLIVRFHPISIDHGVSGIELPPYILPLLPSFIQQCLDGNSTSFISSSTRNGSLAMAGGLNTMDGS